MKRIIKANLALLIILIFSSCSQEYLSLKDKAFNELIQIRDMNKSMSLEMWDVNEIRNLRIGNDIVLAGINHTKNNIIFPSGYGISILVFDESANKWNDIPDTAIYSSPGKQILLPKSEDNQGITAIGLFPCITSNGKPIELRVVVRGETRSWIPFVNKQVGAYIDLIFQP
jgi:hypothetical protein